MTMADHITIDQTQTKDSFNLVTLFNEANQCENENGNDSPFTSQKNLCNYYTPNEFSQLPHYNNTLISLFCINCRSINAHWDHLQELLLNMNKTNFLFDLIGLTEVFHIRDDISYNLTGYHSLQYSTRSDADDGRGGIALYIKDDLTYSKRGDLSIFIPHVFESIFFEIKRNLNKPVIVGVIYRPNTQPRANFDLFTNHILEIQGKISNEGKLGYLMGDYNINLLNFGTHQKTNEFLDDVISQGFVPHITKPTRITPVSATLIDHIYSNHTYVNFNSGIIITDVADHFGIFHVVYQDKVKTNHHPRHIQIRQLKKDNIRNFKNYLAVANYSSVLATNNTNDAYNNFLDIYQYLFDIACPLKQILVKNKYIKRQPWITSGILTSSINKAKLLHKKLSKPTELNIELYKNYCRVFNVLKRAAKASYYTAILNEYKYNIKSGMFYDKP